LNQFGLLSFKSLLHFAQIGRSYYHGDPPFASVSSWRIAPGARESWLPPY
jgi:hypothetical protein